MLPSLLLATSNQGKIIEAKSLLSRLECKLFTPKEVPALDDLEVEETGNSFEANALLKARSYAMLSNLPALAEDSGLTIDFLDGFPGLKSARWTKGSDKDRCIAILNKMKDASNRNAHYICVVCLYHPVTQKHLCFIGQVDGVISPTLSGINGFGYDPIFIPSGFGLTYAQLGEEVKNQYSHRQKALEQVATYLTDHPEFLGL